MSVSKIEEGKTYWYGVKGAFVRVTAVRLLVSPGEPYEQEILYLVESSMVRRHGDGVESLYAREVRSPPVGDAPSVFGGYELFPDKAAAVKAWATELRKQADAIESM